MSDENKYGFGICPDEPQQNEQPNGNAESSFAAPPLLACPFCGGQHIPEHPKMKEQWPCTSQPKLEELTEGGWRVTCYGCGVGTWNNLKYTKEQAVAAWNTRGRLTVNSTNPVRLTTAA
jgi:hypothetical protein